MRSEGTEKEIVGGDLTELGCHQMESGEMKWFDVNPTNTVAGLASNCVCISASTDAFS